MNSRISRPRRALARWLVDALEARRLLSGPEATLTLTGTAAGDSIILDYVAPNYRFTLNGVVTLYPAAGVTEVRVEALGGNDVLYIERNNGVPTGIYGGDGADSIHLSYSAENLSDLPGHCQVYGQSGEDTLVAWDRYNGAATTYNVNALDIVRPGFGSSYYSSDVEHLKLYTSISGSTTTITSTDAATDVNLWVSGTSNTVHIGDILTGAQIIASRVKVDGTSGATFRLAVSDLGNSTARTATLDYGVDGYGHLTGLAPASIDFQTSTATEVRITTGSAADTVNVLATRQPTFLDSSGGNDRVNVGSNSGVQNIFNSLWVDNYPAYTTLLVDDGPAGGTRDVTVDTAVVDGVLYNVVTGLAPAQILYDSSDIESVTLRGGLGVETYYTLRSTEDLTITTSGGADVVNVGNSTNGVQGITGPLHVMNPPNYSTLNIFDAVNTTARSAVIDTAGPKGVLTGLAPAQIDWVTADIGGAGVTIMTGSAADTVNVRKLSTGMRLTNPSTAGDIIRVGDPTYGTNYISATLLIENPLGLSSLEIDDHVGVSARVVSFSYEDIGGSDWGRIDGLGGMGGRVYYKLRDIANPVVYRSGAGSDSFYVSRTRLVELNIFGGGGNDYFQLTSNDATQIKSPVWLDGETGSDECRIMDTAAVDANGFTVNAQLITRTGMSNVQCVSMEDLYLLAGGGASKTHRIIDTAPGYGVHLIDGSSSDMIEVQRTTGAPVYVEGTSLDDDLWTSTSGPSTIILPAQVTHVRSIVINGDGVVYVGSPNETLGDGQKVLVTVLWSIFYPGRIDLGPHSMVLECSSPGSADPADSLRTGYGTGTWNGYALLTRFGDASRYGLGYAESSEVLGPSGGTFHGVPVDNTAWLISFTRYGDTNLDRVVNIGDFARMASNFNSASRWFRGNFNYDWQTNISDFAMLAANYNRGVPGDLPLGGRMFGTRLIEDVGLTADRVDSI